MSLQVIVVKWTALVTSSLQLMVQIVEEWRLLLYFASLVLTYLCCKTADIWGGQTVWVTRYLAMAMLGLAV